MSHPFFPNCWICISLCNMPNNSSWYKHQKACHLKYNSMNNKFRFVDWNRKWAMSETFSIFVPLLFSSQMIVYNRDFFSADHTCIPCKNTCSRLISLLASKRISLLFFIIFILLQENIISWHIHSFLVSLDFDFLGIF